MKRILITLVLAGVLINCQHPKPDVSTVSLTQEEELILRGKYLVEIMDCAFCHTPKIMTPNGPVPDTTRLFSGHPARDELTLYDSKLIMKDGWALMSSGVTAFVGPWGESYAGNLTPDSTGIGSWTLEQFTIALKEGKHKGLKNARPLMPPMPVAATAHLSDVDVKAIYFYLQTVKPIRNVVRSYESLASE